MCHGFDRERKLGVIELTRLHEGSSYLDIAGLPPRPQLQVWKCDTLHLLSHSNVFCLSDIHLEGYKNTRDAAKLKGPARTRILT
jgi:hypothetical protein